MRKLLIAILILLMPAELLSQNDVSVPGDLRLFDVRERVAAPLADMVTELKKYRVILVGEHHTTKSHHLGQLEIIKALNERHVTVAIGLEMFRNNSQDILNRWVAGSIDQEDFLAIYQDNWNFEWHLYRMIFEYARENKIPMVGLNVPRDITRQVAYSGFASLSDEQKGRLPEVACRVDKAYMAYIRKAFGAHAHGNLNFTHFCEAQLVWDTAMAIHAMAYLTEHPRTVMVILTGTGHAHKRGIPRQIKRRSSLPVAVILPETAPGIGRHGISPEDADYVLVDLETLAQSSCFDPSRFTRS